MAEQLDKGEAEGSFPIGGGGIKDIRKLNIKMGFRTLSSPRRADKGRSEHIQYYGLGVTVFCQHTTA
jgi:hypothetical protein